MTIWTIIRRSLRFHARSHIGTLLGATVGSAVLIGALVVGDSMRASLHRMAMVRLGRVELALASGERLFREELAESIRTELEAPVTAALQLPGAIVTADGTRRANQAHVFGVSRGFWEFANQKPDLGELDPDALILNDALARHLAVEPGDTLVIRVLRPTDLSRDAPLAPEEDTAVPLRLKVSRVIDDEQFGRFSLRASQLPPFNAFMSLAELQKRLDIGRRANLMLVARARRSDAGKIGPDEAVTVARAITALKRTWQLDDAQLELRDLPELEALELRTPRVFLDPSVSTAALNVAPDAEGILTYFVNELRAGDRATPYSMVSALDARFVPADLADTEILVNQWLADDLQVKVGDELRLTYYVVGLGRELLEKSARFRIRAILPMPGPGSDVTLMPDFPGLTDADNCRDWDTGFPIDTTRIRDRDEDYWDEHRGTPKAFVNLATGQRLWGNRFGNLSAVRFPATSDPSPRQSLERDVLDNLEPGAVGLSFEPVREQALAAVAGSQDFGGLFIGFSFFLILAALLLMSLLYQFGVEQRSEEVGTLIALGFTPDRVRRLLLLEGGVLALIGGGLGMLVGTGYARIMLRGLATIWRDAVGTSALVYHAQLGTLIIGALAGFIVAWITVWFALRRQANQPVRVLLAGGGDADQNENRLRPVRRRYGQWVAWSAILGAVVLVGTALGKGDTASSGVFFGAGALLLLGGLALSSQVLNQLARSERTGRLTLAGLGIRNTARRRRRSLATLGLFACGSFLIASIGVFRLDAVRDAEKRSSGTGGFALIGQTTLPAVLDLNGTRGQEFYALEPTLIEDVRFVSLKVKDGDDASCLNLNRAQRPRLLGVKPKQLAERHAFSFAKIAGGLPQDNPWSLLETSSTDEIPAIGDLNSILWAMGKKVGDTLDYTDERGRPFRIRIVGAVANSILQGNLLIDEQAFVRLFPSEAGYRMFLIDAPSVDLEQVSTELGRGLRDVGLELIPTTRRLAQFNAVQNTYLGTFQVLGGLGLLLGSVGLGVLVLRNVLERRAELAVLLAVGFRSSGLMKLVVSEHAALLVGGLTIGTVAALVAVLPSVLSPAMDLPYLSLALTLGGVFLSGAVWTWAATALALRGKLLEALRNE